MAIVTTMATTDTTTIIIIIITRIAATTDLAFNGDGGFLRVVSDDSEKTGANP